MSQIDLVSALVVYYEREGYGEEALVADISRTAEELLAGVTISTISFGDSTGSGQVNRSPKELLPLLNSVLDAMRGKARVERAQAGFAGRYLST